MTEIPLKQCSRKEECVHPESNHGYLPKTLEYFSRSKNGRDGMRAECRKCNNAERALRRKRNPERAREADRHWRRQNIEHVREYDRKRYWDNPEKYKARVLEGYYRNRDTRRAHMKIYAAAHRDNSLARQRRWRENCGDAIRLYHRAWKHNHPYRARIDQARRRALKRGLPDQFTTADWHTCLDYFNGCCAVCGRPPGLWHTLAQEHWIPLTDPRSDNPGTVPMNIVPMCHARKGGEGGCNNFKFTKDPETWLVERFGKRKAKVISKRIHAYFEWVKTQGGD